MYEILCAIWYHLYNLKSVKNTHGGMILLVKLQTSSMVVFHVFQIVQVMANRAKRLICRGVRVSFCTICEPVIIGREGSIIFLRILFEIILVGKTRNWLCHSS